MPGDVIQQDIEQSKKQESCNIQMTDGKIVCSFSMNADPGSEYGKWVYYPKVFDDWDSFVEYSKEFFKSNSET